MHRLISSFVFSTLLLCNIAWIHAQQQAKYDSALLTVINDTMVAAEAPGIVDQIYIDAGVNVEIGQTIVSLNKNEFEAQLKVAKMRAIIAEIEADNDVNRRFARKSLEVNEKLLNRSETARVAYTKSVSMTDIDRLELEVQQSKLSAEQAELQAEIAENQSKLEKENVAVATIRLANRDIKSPLAGRIEQVFVQRGEWVNAGQPIARIVDITKLRIRAIFDLQFVKRIRVGDTATFSYALNEKNFTATATVSYVSSIIQKGKFQVWVDIDNPEMILVPGVQGELIVDLSGN